MSAFVGPIIVENLQQLLKFIKQIQIIMFRIRNELYQENNLPWNEKFLNNKYIKNGNIKNLFNYYIIE